ncbi:MAG: glycoside hydrolase family 3 protein, partial [Bacteroidetes bacterium]|nr:glycoside hydrolase family 3 protein [Bacteroidota bacterium]
AIRDGGARSVMNSYAEIDGAPVGAVDLYLTDILRGKWGFDGVVVSDYFSVVFLPTMHRIAVDRADAARLALTAGLDGELPSADAYAALPDLVRSHALDEAVLDRAVARVLAEKEELGLLDATFDEPAEPVDLDSAEHRGLARELAEESEYDR